MMTESSLSALIVPSGRVVFISGTLKATKTTYLSSFSERLKKKAILPALDSALSVLFLLPFGVGVVKGRA